MFKCFVSCTIQAFFSGLPDKHINKRQDGLFGGWLICLLLARDRGFLRRTQVYQLFFKVGGLWHAPVLRFFFLVFLFFSAFLGSIIFRNFFFNLACCLVSVDRPTSSNKSTAKRASLLQSRNYISQGESTLRNIFLASPTLWALGQIFIGCALLAQEDWTLCAIIGIISYVKTDDTFIILCYFDHSLTKVYLFI
jgi:hypothetical protein